MCSGKKFQELFLFDAYISILKIKKVASMFENAEAVFKDFICWDSILREFEILGEASKHLLKSELIDKKYRVVVDFRNLLIHNYFGVSPDEVWNVINNDLLEFENEILKAIVNIEPELKKKLVDSYIKMNGHLNFVVEALKKL